MANEIAAARMDGAKGVQLAATSIRAMKPNEPCYGLTPVKGDFCFRELPLGCWRLQVVYGQDRRVLRKYCFLRLGTRNYFKDFYREDSGT